MDPDDLSYVELRNIIKSEKASPRLTKLDPRFYDAVAKRITKLENEFMNHQRITPSSRKIVLLADELRNTKRIFDEIYELREKKISMAALAAARGTESEDHNMTSIERDFFEAVKHVLKMGRTRFVSGRDVDFKSLVIKNSEPRKREANKVFGESRPFDGAGEEGHGLPETFAPSSRGDACETRPHVAVNHPSRLADNIMTVKALQDVPGFVGTDMKHYELRKEDVATLPRDVADILVKSGAVAELGV